MPVLWVAFFKTFVSIAKVENLPKNTIFLIKISNGNFWGESNQLTLHLIQF